ncbi:MAG: hypothetical protein JRC68_03075 [Deltaproteobacteria bacterium]|nr:hypothetical protein [Deltaproteobacteria bacterium]
MLSKAEDFLDEESLKVNTKEIGELCEAKSRFLIEVYWEYVRSAFVKEDELIKEIYPEDAFKKFKDKKVEYFPPSWKDYFKKYVEDRLEKTESRKILRSFLSLKYRPPIHKRTYTSILEIMNHLACLIYYFMYLSPNLPLEVTTSVDLAMTRVVHQTTRGIRILGEKRGRPESADANRHEIGG